MFTEPQNSPSTASLEGRLAEIVALAPTDLEAAARLAAQAKADGVRAPLVQATLGLAHKRAGRFEEAIAEYGLGLELDPNDAAMTTEVGFCLMHLGRRREAANVFAAAMKLNPELAAAAFGYGWAAEGVGALDSAESAFRRALLLDPDHPDSLVGLAGLALRKRDWDTARTLSERAAANDPRNTDAPLNLARVDLGVGDYAAARERLRQLLAGLDLPGPVRANAHIHLGDALDGEGDYQAAFAAYGEGNAELRALHADQFERPGMLRGHEVVRAMAEEFRRTPPAAWVAPATTATGPARGHAFLTGFPRSGTTLLEQVIATHPDMTALGERPVMLEAEREFVSSSGGIERLAATLGPLLEPFRQSYWRRVREFGVNPAGKVFVDKHPLATMRLPLMWKMFPNAKLIFALRDPRDVVLSCFRRSFNMNANMYELTTLEGAARLYDAVMSAGEAYLEQLPIEVLRIRNEDVVDDFDGASRRLCDFLHVDWTPGLRDFAATPRNIATPSSAQVARGLSGEGVGHWRHYAPALEPVLPILQPWIEKFGYPAA
jgi:tetratricopeptide (TPR) repeat protein